MFRYCLRVIKPALCDKTITIFHGKIKNCYGDFHNRQQLLSHLCNEFLPNCDQSHGYKFFIDINYSDGVIWITPEFVISSILETLEVSRCSNVEFCVLTNSNNFSLPVDAIANWLNQNFTNTENQNGTKTKKGIKSLTISEGTHILNDGAMCDRLKQVIFY